MRVVIADDSSVCRDELRSQLATLGHTVVGIGRYGQEAIDLCAKHKPDLVILDMAMTQPFNVKAFGLIQDGVTAAKVIIGAKTAGALVLATSQKNIMENQAKALGVPCCVKPYKRHRLEQMIAEATAGRV